jgi:HSP20 family protein
MAAPPRFDPFRDLQAMQAHMNRLFDDVFGSARGQQPAGEGASMAAFAPAVDLWEAPEAYYLRVYLPGVAREDVKIEVHNDTLVVSGERKATGAPEAARWLRQEGGYGPFYRAVALPTAVDAEKVQARVQHGVLEVIIPKAEAAKPKRVPITS